MKVLVSGCGSIGKRHARNIRDLGGYQVSLMDLDAQVAQSAARELSLPWGTNFDEELDKRPDVVFIATPPSSHVVMARQALKAGAHVFIEKPLSAGWDGVDALAREAESAGRTAMVGCNMRFHPNLAFIKQAVSSGRLGRIYAVRAEVASYLPGWRPGSDYRKNYAARRSEGGGVLLDSIHELDYLQWIGGAIEEVKCMAGRVSGLEIETEDCADVIFKFQSGAFGSLHLDYLQHSYARGCKWVGERGTMTWDMKEGCVRFFDDAAGEWSDAHRLPAGYDINSIYLDEIRHFFEAIRTGATPMGGLAEAALALKWTLQCQEDAGLASGAIV